MWKVTMISTEEELRRDGYGINIEWCENHESESGAVMRFVKSKDADKSYRPFTLHIFGGNEEEEEWTAEKEWADKNYQNYPSIEQNPYSLTGYHSQNPESMSEFIRAIKNGVKY